MIVRTQLGGGFGVKNVKTGLMHSYHTTLTKAKAQIRLLNAIDHGFIPRKK
jgi:hypothetical protein